MDEAVEIAQSYAQLFNQNNSSRTVRAVSDVKVIGSGMLSRTSQDTFILII